MTWLLQHWKIVLIIVFGAALRFYGFADWSLSNDELSYLTRLELSNAWEAFQYGMENDVHPPAVQTLLFYWSRIFGDSPAALRFPFVVFGTLSIFLIYQIGRNAFNESTGLLSAAFLACLEYPLLFSRITRPYAFGLMVVLATALIMERLLNSDSPKKSLIIGTAICLALCAYTHYFCALTAGVLGLVGLVRTNRHNRISYLLSGIGSIVLFAPYIPFLLQHLSLGGLGGWLPEPTPGWVVEYLFHSVNDSYLVLAALIGLIILSLVVHGTQQSNVVKGIQYLLIFLGTFLVGYLYSVTKQPVMEYSGLLFAFPFLLLGLFGLLNLNTKTLKIAVPVVLVIIGFDTVARQQFYTTEHYGVFRQLVEKAIEVKSEDPNALLIADVNHELYFDYFAERSGNDDLRFDNYSLTEGDDLKRLHWLCKNSGAETCLFAWSTKGQLPEHAAIIEYYFPRILSESDHFNSGFIHFSKEEPTDVKWSSSFQETPVGSWNANSNGLTTDSLGWTYIFTDSTEFGPTLEIEIGEGLSGYSVVTVTTQAKIQQEDSQFQLVCSQQLVDGSDHWESRPFNLQLNSNRTGTAVFRFELREGVKNGGILKIYPWLPQSEESAILSKMKVELAVRASFQ